MKDGENIGYYDSGEMRSKCNYLGGKLHGDHIAYLISGVISIKCNYLDDNLHGEYINYGESGDIKSKYYYINGDDVDELEWICYNRNLKLEFLGL